MFAAGKDVSFRTTDGKSILVWKTGSTDLALAFTKFAACSRGPLNFLLTVNSTTAPGVGRHSTISGSTN
jgi:hypothetical protein